MPSVEEARAAGVFVGDADNPEDLGDGWFRFYGLATSSSSYGGYGGTENTSREEKYKVGTNDAHA